MAAKDRYNEDDLIYFFSGCLKEEDIKSKDVSMSDFSSLEESLQNSLPLCVPNDSLEDLEWYPNFIGDSISLPSLLMTTIDGFTDSNSPSSMNSEPRRGLSISDSEEKDQTEHDRRVPLKDLGLARQAKITSKKPRSKRICGNERTLKREFGLSSSEDENPYNVNLKNRFIIGRRKCTHCQAENTPQWRMGPTGPKTLCNACGVRYKAGKLVAEYRPAASPSFNSQVHSNSHKTIMKMKRFKVENRQGFL